MFNWKNKLLSSIDLKRQNKILNKKHNVDVATLISKRILNPNNGSFIGGKLEIDDRPFDEEDRKNYGKKLSEQVRNKSKELVVQLPSTAIANARFDEDKGAIYITYVGGDKEYVFKGNKQTWLNFMNAGSKGRYVQYVMKVMSQAPRGWWS